jgi:DNA-directed RNA polymerase subunit K/omega
MSRKNKQRSYSENTSDTDKQQETNKLENDNSDSSDEEININEDLDENAENDDIETKNENLDDYGTCVYTFAKNNDNSDSEESNNGDDDFFEDGSILNTNIIVPAEERITKAILYHYEYVRLKLTRAQQLSLGAQPMIKNVENLDSKHIAQLEIYHKKIPIIIERTLPDNTKEHWKINELTDNFSNKGLHNLE